MRDLGFGQETIAASPEVIAAAFADASEAIMALNTKHPDERAGGEAEMAKYMQDYALRLATQANLTLIALRTE